MKLSHAILATVPVALAAPSQLDARDTQNVQVTFQLSKLTQEAAVKVWNKDETKLLGQSCTNSIESGAFKQTPIVFTVNEGGIGEMAVGATKYKTYGNASSDGVSCGRITSSAEIMIKCRLTLPAALALAPLLKRDLASCFPTGPVELHGVMKRLASEPMPSHAQLPAPTVETAVNTTDLDKRQRVCEISSQETYRIGDGNPHQNPKHIQVSQVKRCTQGTCTVGYAEGRSFAINWSTSLSVGGWISGGFAVEKTHHTGTYSECNGLPWEWMAVWKSVGQTAYTVETKTNNRCGNPGYSGHYVMWSPNNKPNHYNHYFYCVYGEQYVRGLGDWYIEHGRAGGP
ncbi:hypothetical protein QBC37DRAFT_374737 [Rhypophila decipiens]|uniref:Uncharacterized protein n=1 Tax=Rhypophila decipiens TaxID=261697 RepID=A0AAN7B6L6_9PEZI|nr:hypothetical protein QBC37DRAFT_374737 [Rhypophila decipiens]